MHHDYSGAPTLMHAEFRGHDGPARGRRAVPPFSGAIAEYGCHARWDAVVGVCSKFHAIGQRGDCLAKIVHRWIVVPRGG
jgi:hypothetical protein